MRDHQEISGDLVLYALRELPEAQAAEMRQHLESCPQCRRELNEINSDIAIMALSTVGPMPPQRSRERLLNSIKNEPRRRRSLVMRRPWWSLAPYFALVLLAVFGLLLWRENSTLRRRLDAAEQRSVQQAADLDRARMVMDVLTNPGANHYVLAADKNAVQPEGRASFIPWKGLVFTASHMKRAPEGKTYQLWLIPEKGAPMPAGTFNPDERGNASIIMPKWEKAPPAKMFAVTIEPDGGSQTPTMPIIMAGA
jgi:hypothetical protein